MIKEPTQLDGVLMDLVYLHQLFPCKNVNAVVKNMYFSDHGVVKLQILVEENDEIHFERKLQHCNKTQFEVRSRVNYK